nr:DUF2235 domain-containing protein [Mesorhizobium waimense]
MIFLMDGTGSDATYDLFSNVYSLNQIIGESKKHTIGRTYHHKSQVTFYLPGIGTRFTVSRLIRKSGFFWITEKVRENVFGDNLEQLVIRAYVNLCANYRPGDDIILVGFSRGAAAARILSRFISDFGILRSEMLIHLDSLWNEFTTISRLVDDNDYRSEIAKLKAELAGSYGEKRPVFHQLKANEMPIKFMGLFDTVVGPKDNELYLDLKFRDLVPASGVQAIVHLMSMHDMREEFILQRFQLGTNGGISGQKVREIWVPGVHSDVGGGYEENFVSNVCLLSMSDMLAKYGGVALDRSGYQRVVSQIKAKRRENRIVVNPEPFVPQKKSRSHMVHVGDEFHPLHLYLLKKFVVWKHSSNTERYRDDFENLKYVTDADLRETFRAWIR